VERSFIRVTSVHFLFSPIPVLGRIDTLLLLLLGIRQMLANCPPDVARGGFERLSLSPLN